MKPKIDVNTVFTLAGSILLGIGYMLKGKGDEGKYKEFITELVKKELTQK